MSLPAYLGLVFRGLLPAFHLLSPSCLSLPPFPPVKPASRPSSLPSLLPLPMVHGGRRQSQRRHNNACFSNNADTPILITSEDEEADSESSDATVIDGKNPLEEVVDEAEDDSSKDSDAPLITKPHGKGPSTNMNGEASSSSSSFRAYNKKFFREVEARHLSKIKDSAENHIAWEIGLGNISFWYDNWLGSSSLSQILPTYPHDNKEVAEFLTDSTWDTRKIQFLSHDIIIMISNVPIGTEILDRCIFTLTKSQSFEFKATWQEIRPRGFSITIGPFWSRALPIKISFFIWRLIKNLLLVETVMQNRGFHLASKCRCCANIESIDHLFFSSNMA
ncbi:hypothetical protein KSP39_PZI007099 [Platanthera zijinensis]|uniref:Reverse transcriptase zinc-binding domain-containing protein n=1 Tax=Platanthera zijinensis TaxID=2320716 RepID=A0AAP0GA10_9ASPA